MNRDKHGAFGSSTKEESPKHEAGETKAMERKEDSKSMKVPSAYKGKK